MKKLIIISLLWVFAIPVRAGHANYATAAENTGTLYSPTAGLLFTTADPIKFSALPKAAQQFIRENYPIRQVKQVSKFKNDKNETVYEVRVRVEDKIAVVQFDTQGELLSETTENK